MEILSSSNSENIDVLTAGFRTIKLNRIFKDKIKTFECMSNGYVDNENLTIPKLTSSRSEIKDKTKKLLRGAHSREINSLSENKINHNNFISSDEFRINLWDLNTSDEVYNVVDIEPSFDSETSERITRSVVCNYNPHLFVYGTNKGNIKLCDLRTSSDHIYFSSNFYDENSNLNKTIFANSLLSIHDICMSPSNSYSFTIRNFLCVNLWDVRKQNEPNAKFLVYEPVINKLSYLYQNNYLNDKFSLSSDCNGKFILTGGYNNMFHILDIEQRLNTQIVIDDNNEKVMNTNVIRKINSKGSCFYKKDDPSFSNINFDKKILHQAYSPVENCAIMIVYNCIYSYVGNIHKKDGTPISNQK
jgi:serine/threonine-protein phosphatase 2A regulatory subunit B